MRAAQKHSSVITLEPLVNFSQKRLCQTRRNKLVHLCDRSYGSSLLSKIVHDTGPILAGKSPDRINRIMLQHLLPIIDDMGNNETVDLNSWIRHAITIVSTNTTYGNSNPFKNQYIEESVWWVYPAYKLLQNPSNTRTGNSNVMWHYYWPTLYHGYLLVGPGRHARFYVLRLSSISISQVMKTARNW